MTVGELFPILEDSMADRHHDLPCPLHKSLAALQAVYKLPHGGISAYTLSDGSLRHYSQAPFSYRFPPFFDIASDARNWKFSFFPHEKTFTKTLDPASLYVTPPEINAITAFFSALPRFILWNPHVTIEADSQPSPSSACTPIGIEAALC